MNHPKTYVEHVVAMVSATKTGAESALLDLAGQFDAMPDVWRMSPQEVAVEIRARTRELMGALSGEDAEECR